MSKYMLEVGILRHCFELLVSLIFFLTLSLCMSVRTNSGDEVFSSFFFSLLRSYWRMHRSCGLLILYVTNCRRHRGAILVLNAVPRYELNREMGLVRIPGEHRNVSFA